MIQEVHDSIMRESLEEFSGVEVHTQGDAFEMVFPSVAKATKFCLAAQRKLLQYPWPKQVDMLPDCKPVLLKDGLESKLFSGKQDEYYAYALWL